MVENPLFDEFSDVLSVFVRTSADYLGRGKLNPETTSTYRPVTMLTLVGTHAFAPREIAHHAVGWLLHVLTAWLLYLGLSKRNSPGRVDPVAAWLAGLFLLHPVGVEAYVWINGRSDLVAGFFLALLVVLRPGRARLSIALVAAWLLIGFLGTAAKLPFAVAALFLWVGAWLRQEAASRRASHLALAASLTSGIGLFVLLRMLYTPFADHVGATVGSGAAAFWAPAPKVAATAVHALVSLRASAMQSMAWNAIQPWSLAQATAAFVLLLSVAGLVWRRDWGGVAYVAGALLTLAPTLFVTQRIWFGFDRYLYMPLILALLAAEPYVRRLVARLASRRRFVRLVGASVLLIAALSTNFASLAYAGHAEFMQALLNERPEDPTVHVYVTSMLHAMGDRENAAEQLRKLPGPPWPRATIVPQIRFAADLGNRPLFDETIVYAKTTYPDDPEIVLETMRWDYQHRRLEQLIESARNFPEDDAAACAAARDQIRQWSETLDEAEQRRLGDAANQLRCAGG
jgi:hypothetical protein